MGYGSYTCVPSRQYVEVVVMVGLLSSLVAYGQPSLDQDSLRISYAAASPVVSLGEPVVVMALIKNLGPAALNVETGPDESGNFEWTVVDPAGKVAEYPYREPVGDVGVFIGSVSVSAQATQERQIVLDERSRFQMPGQYLVRIRYRPTGEEGSISVTVTPRDEVRLLSRCRSLIEGLRNAHTFTEGQTERRQLSAFSDPIVVRFLADAARMEPRPDILWVAEALSRFGTSEAVAALLEIHAGTKGLEHDRVRSLLAHQVARTDVGVALRMQVTTLLNGECGGAKRPANCPALETQR